MVAPRGRGRGRGGSRQNNGGRRTNSSDKNDSSSELVIKSDGGKREVVKKSLTLSERFSQVSKSSPGPVKGITKKSNTTTRGGKRGGARGGATRGGRGGKGGKPRGEKKEKKTKAELDKDIDDHLGYNTENKQEEEASNNTGSTE